MRCPNCALENPPSALRCDCGYGFQEKKILGVEKRIPGHNTTPWGMLILCLVVPFMGFVLFVGYRRQGRRLAAKLAALAAFLNLLAMILTGGPHIHLRFH